MALTYPRPEPVVSRPTAPLSAAPATAAPDAARRWALVVLHAPPPAVDTHVIRVFPGPVWKWY